MNACPIVPMSISDLKGVALNLQHAAARPGAIAPLASLGRSAPALYAEITRLRQRVNEEVRERRRIEAETLNASALERAAVMAAACMNPCRISGLVVCREDHVHESYPEMDQLTEVLNTRGVL